MDAMMSRLQASLSPARFNHSLGVMGVMDALAQVYGFDREQARIAGLLHDAAKEYTPAQYAQVAQAAGIAPSCAAEQDYNLYWHGPVGACVVRAVYGVTDKAVLDAIATHTFCDGDNFHAPLSWCLRFSDILEPNRVWSGETARAVREGAPGVREAAFAGKLFEAALLHVRMVVRFLGENHYALHPNYPRVLVELQDRGQ